MARGHGRILTSIWEDADFLALDEREQRLYLFLISQPNLNHAGLLDLTLRRWARKARGLTSADLEKLLQALEAARFIVMDDDTEELLIRSFIRNDGVWRMPKVMGAMVSGALEISSKRLQRALLAEVDRIPLDELSDEPAKLRGGGEGPSIRSQVSAHIDTLRTAFQNPEPDPTEGGSGTPSTPPSGIPSDTPAEGGPKGSTRGHAALYVRAAPAPAPAPAPNPSPVEDVPGPAVDEAEPEIFDVDCVESANADHSPEPVTAQTIVGEYLARVVKRPPRRVIGQLAKQIKEMLDESIDPDDIRRGVAAWMTKNLHPATLPSVVNEVMNTGADVISIKDRQQQATDDQFARAAARAEARMQQQESS